MVETNFFEFFKATWAQNGITDRISAAQYSTGWAYIGSLPPSVEQFNAVQQITDQKLAWIYRHLEAVATLTGRALTAPGSDAISYAFQNLDASRLTAGTVPAERLPEKAPAMTVGAAAKWETPRSISISGGATAVAKPFDGSANLALDVTSVSMNMAAGVLAPNHGGTGLDWIPPGNYLVGNGTATMTSKTPGQVFNDIGVAGAIQERMELFGLGANYSTPLTNLNQQALGGGLFATSKVGGANNWLGEGVVVHRLQGQSGFQLGYAFGSGKLQFRERSLGAWLNPITVANLDGPAFTGTPTAPTPGAGDRSTRIATTAFVSDNSLRKCAASALPTTDVGPVFVVEFGEIWGWVSTPNYTGYRSSNCGQIAYFSTDQVPMGWLRANGTDASRTAFGGMFSVLGTRFGTGNGVTTFGLPDLRGEFIRGWDDGRLVDPGRVLGTAQAATAIRMLIDNYVGYPTGTLAVGMRNVDGILYGAGSDNATVGADSTFYVASTTARGGANDNTAYLVRPRNVALLACIKI